MKITEYSIEVDGPSPMVDRPSFYAGPEWHEVFSSSGGTAYDAGDNVLKTLHEGGLDVPEELELDLAELPFNSVSEDSDDFYHVAIYVKVED